MKQDKELEQMENKKPVIDESEGRSKLRKTVEFILAVIGTLLMWFVLFLFVYKRIFVEADGRAIDALLLLTVIGVVVILVQGGWQFYNWYLYHGTDRRQSFPWQPLDVVGRLYGIEEPDMQTLQDVRQSTVVRFEDGKYYYVIDGEAPIEIVSLRGQ